MKKRYINTSTYNRTLKNKEAAKENPFTRTDMSLVQDERLSAEALGYMVYILAQSDKFIINKGQVLRRFGRSPSAKNKAWDMLEELGYIIKKRNGSGCHYTINEVCPQNSAQTVPVLEDTMKEEDQIMDTHIMVTKNVDTEDVHRVIPMVVNTHNMDTQIVNPLSMNPSDIELTTNNSLTTTKELTTENFKPNICKTEWVPNPPPPPILNPDFIKNMLN